MFKPTLEQQTNLSLLKSGKDVKIIAGAGSGKSSSLRYMAASMPHKTFLVWCFNAANAEESNNHPDKPDNIIYSTGHSTAYREVIDSRMRKKLGPYLNYNELPNGIQDIAHEVSIDDKTFNTAKTILLRSALDCITYFCRSNALGIADYAEWYYTYHHTVNDYKTNLVELPLTVRQVDKMVQIVCDYWINLGDSYNLTQITHDVYLKMYQLSGTTVKEVWDKVGKRFVKPDIIALDEAQDTNPVMQAIFERQPHQKMLIGDPMQQLYAWRGAGDAMKSFTDFSVGYLTESFRFNSTIADMANLVLHKAGSDMQVKGSSTKQDITSYAHLCRTNASVVARIFAELGSGKKVYTSIKVSDVFSKLYHMQSCWFNEKPKYPSKELASIVDKESLLKALEYSEELQRLNKLSQHLTAGGNTLTAAKKQLDSILVKTPVEADIVISTIHASKGMEYDYVAIDADFLIVGEDETEADAIERLWESEPLYCMLYVAITRGRVECTLPAILINYFEYMLKPTPLPDLSIEKETGVPCLVKAPYVVYSLYDKTGSLLYIGVTVNLDNRLKHHYLTDNWFKQVNRYRTEIIPFNSRGEAYKERAKAIKERQPMYSDIYRDGKE